MSIAYTYVFQKFYQPVKYKALPKRKMAIMQRRHKRSNPKLFVKRVHEHLGPFADARGNMKFLSRG